MMGIFSENKWRGGGGIKLKIVKYTIIPPL